MAANSVTSPVKPKAPAFETREAHARSLSVEGPVMDKIVMVGGAAMYPTKTIVDNVVHSKDHTTLVAAL